MIAFVQARMGSTRLPGKILRLLPDNQTLIERIFYCLEEARTKPFLITSKNSENQPLISLAESKQWSFFEGDETDVLGRFIAAASHFGLTDDQWILRVCADNPFLSTAVVEKTVQAVGENPQLDYISLGYNQIPGIKLHAGIFVEAVKIKALKAVHAENNSWFNEHVTLGIYSQPNKFSVLIQEIPNHWSQGFESIRLTIDDSKDWDFIQEIYPIFKHQDFPEFQSALLSNKNWVNLMTQQISKYQK